MRGNFNRHISRNNITQRGRQFDKRQKHSLAWGKRRWQTEGRWKQGKAVRADAHYKAVRADAHYKTPATDSTSLGRRKNQTFTPSPNKPFKKPKYSEASNSAAVAEQLLVVAPSGYPEVKFSREQVDNVALQLTQLIEATESKFELKYNGYNYSKGALTLTCLDKPSRDWAAEQVSSLLVDGLKMFAAEPEILTKRVKAEAFFPGSGLTVDSILSCVRKQNWSVGIEKWSIVSLQEEQDKGGFYAIMRLPKNLIPALQKAENKLFFRLHSVQVSLISDKKTRKIASSQPTITNNPTSSQQEDSYGKSKQRTREVNNGFCQRSPELPEQLIPKDDNTDPKCDPVRNFLMALQSL